MSKGICKGNLSQMKVCALPSPVWRSDWSASLGEFQNTAHQSCCFAQCAGVSPLLESPVLKIMLHFVLQKDFYLCLVVRMKTRER